MKERSFALRVCALVLLTVIFSVSVASAADVVVSNSNDSGPGSFREAIVQANGDSSIVRIVFIPSVNTIDLHSTVFFTGIQDLTIEGNNATLDGRNAGGSAFIVNGGGDLTVLDLTVQNAPGEGITYEVPGGATGTLRVVLNNITIQNNAGYGVWVDDQVDSSAPDGVQPPDAGSEASLEVIVVSSRFLNNGNDPDHSVSDRDGLRVDEGGLGDLTVTIQRCVVDGNGGDGIELDERGSGNIQVEMVLSSLTRNGQFDANDLEDGFDIDEWNDGSISASITSSSANNNWEEGFDFNENNLGDLIVEMWNLEASGNREEGIDLEEDDDFAGGGNLETTMTAIAANGNGRDDGDGGVKIREKGVGQLEAALTDVAALNNYINGIHVREDAGGTLDAVMTNIISNANTGDGVVFDERGDGDLTASVSKAIAAGNSDDGVQADEAGNGAGTVILTNVILSGNGDSPVDGAVPPTAVD